MRGVVFLGNRKLELREFPDPTPGPGEVVLAIRASGMCGSDLHPYRAAGDAAKSLGLGGAGGPLIRGHEPRGRVAAPRAAAAVPRGFAGRSVHANVAGCFRYSSRSAWSRASVRSRFARPIP